MYRSYSVNDMPQPIRYSGGGGDFGNRPPKSRGGGVHSEAENSNVHTDNIEAERPRPNCPTPELPAQTQNLPQNCPARNCAVSNCPVRGAQSNNGGLLAGLNLKSDDLILLAVAVILLMDGCEDKLLLAALGLVFFSDYLG